MAKAQLPPMNIVILDDYQDAVRKLDCAAKLDAFQAKVYTNTVKGLGQLTVRLKDADVKGVVIRSGKDNAFCAGADLGELGVAYDMIVAARPLAFRLIASGTR